jgi:hypothetical protein
MLTGVQKTKEPQTAAEAVRAQLLELIEHDEVVRDVLVRLLSDEKAKRVFV